MSWGTAQLSFRVTSLVAHNFTLQHTNRQPCYYEVVLGNTQIIVLGAFLKLRKVTFNFRRVFLSLCPSVSLSVCPSTWNISAPIGQISMKYDIWLFFGKFVEKIQVTLKSDNNIRNFTWKAVDILIISRWILLRMRNVSDKNL